MVLPGQYIPAVEKAAGIIGKWRSGRLSHGRAEGDLDDLSQRRLIRNGFKAAYLAFRKLEQADPVLLEPIMKAEVTVNDEYMGDIIGDLNRHRGRSLV